ncbi:hypothetical protein AAF712_010533 [Marasmius tenuissimus]|uniref:Uncharacterized protein n=1 Tax=Marasmius tenuissimus TaxID=585030 RepID=A0ABR2ZN36_9AGAR
MAGLAPTLIIVRVAYRRSVDSVEQMMSIHFAEHSSSQGTRQGPSTLQTTLDIRSQYQISALGGDRVGDTDSEEKIGGSEGRVIDLAKVTSAKVA